jgi:hypothetical protein
MSHNGAMVEYFLTVAFWMCVIMGILRIAFPIPLYLWMLIIVSGAPLLATMLMSIEGSFGEPVANRIVLTGVVLAILFSANKLAGPLSHQTWLTALGAWLLIAVITARFRRSNET